MRVVYYDGGRTYDASRAVGGRATTRLAVMRGEKWLGGGLIHVVQDIRGRHRSEGDYAMYRVPRGEFNASETDETTDAWDTIDWLVKNVAEANGRVGVWGTSYPGWLTLAALREPHPALVAAVPFNPVVDVWKADDWFHWGAFRALYAFEFIYGMETGKGKPPNYPYHPQDLFEFMLDQGAAATGLGPRLDERHEMWPRLVETVSGTRRTSTVLRRCTRPWRGTTTPTTPTSSWPARGTTGSTSPTAAVSGP